MGKSKGPWDLRAAEVLAGRLKLDAAALIALVNEVNPTGRGRDAREAAARYARKAELESLLIERFEGSIEARVDPDDAGVVSIRHRLHQDLACHAKIDALDDDARSWVRRQLDLQEGEEPGGTDAVSAASSRRQASTEIDEEDPDALLEAAEAREAEFDYEAAARFYRAAVTIRPDARGAEAQLRFLVDVLAADTDALALEKSLPSVVRAAPPVRVLLALAAARTGDEARAAKLVAAIGAPRAAEVRTILARAAIARGDAELAGTRLAEASRADPGHPDLRALGDELAKLREGQRAPLERELGELLARGPSDEAFAKAEAILARWPESESARRATRTIEAHRLREEAARAIDEAQALVAKGDLGSARALLRRSLSSGAALDEPLQARGTRALQELDATLHDRAVHEAAQRVLEMLRAKADRWPALAALFDLEDDARATVLAACGEDHAARWVHALRSGEGRSGRSARAAVDAVLALEAASREMTDDPARALITLAPHARMLEALPEARAIEARAKAKVIEHRSAHAILDLARAEAAFEAGELEAASAILDRCRKDLPKDATARGAELLDRIALAGTRRDLPRRFEQLLRARRYEDARHVLSELAALDPETFAERASGFDEEVRAELRMRVDDFDRSAAQSSSLRFGSHPHTYPIEVVPCVDLENGTIVLPNASAQLLWIRSYDLATGNLVRAIEVNTPETMYEPKAWISGDHVSCFGSCMRLELDRATGRALRFTDMRDARGPDYRVSDVHELDPRSRYLWVTTNDSLVSGEVIDRAGERRPREIPGLASVHRLVGRTPPCIAVVRGDSAVSLHEIGGNQTARYDFPAWVRGVAQHPRGDRLIVLCDPPMVPSPPKELSWVEVFPNGTRGAAGVLPDSRLYIDVATATPRDVGITVLAYAETDELQKKTWLVAMGTGDAPGDDAIRVLYRVPISDRWTLAQDPDGRRAFLVAELDTGLRIVEVGREAPELEAAPPRVPILPVPTVGVHGCTAAETSASVKMYVDLFKWIPDGDVAARALAREAELAASSDRTGLLVLFGAVALTDATEVARGIADRLRAQFPDDPDVEQASWTAIALDRSWEELRSLLEPLDVSAHPQPIQQHRHHLLAIACFAVGDVERGREHVADAAALQGKCGLTALATFSEASGSVEVAPGTEADILRSLVAATIEADARLASGDPAGAIRVLETRIVFEHRDAQSLARLASAHLALAVTGSDEVCPTGRRFALGTFVNSLSDARVGFMNEMLIPGATWPLERLLALKREAQSFLEADRTRSRSS